MENFIFSSMSNMSLIGGELNPFMDSAVFSLYPYKYNIEFYKFTFYFNVISKFYQFRWGTGVFFGNNAGYMQFYMRVGEDLVLLQDIFLTKDYIGLGRNLFQEQQFDDIERKLNDLLYKERIEKKLDDLLRRTGQTDFTVFAIEEGDRHKVLQEEHKNLENKINTLGRYALFSIGMCVVIIWGVGVLEGQMQTLLKKPRI